MDTKLLIIFIILNITNVVIQTVKSILTIKGNKYIAAIANAVAYGLYTIVVVYMVCELPLYLKVAIVATCNLIGVFIVKFTEEKTRKDKLLKIELTVPERYTEAVDMDLQNVPHSYVLVGNHTLFNFYCATQTETAKVVDITKQYQAKFFVSESKTIL